MRWAHGPPYPFTAIFRRPLLHGVAGGLCRGPESPYDAGMDDGVRWTLKISPDTDEAVRSYLGRRGRSARALSRLVEDALRAQVFEKSVERVKRMTAGVGAARLRGVVRQAVRHARRAR